MGNGQQQRQQRIPTPEEMAEFQRMDREFKMQVMPPQIDLNGMERICVECHSVLHPIHNRNYDGTTGGFCNKLCAKSHERKKMGEGMTASEADVEVGKYEDWKPKKHSPVLTE